MAAQNGYTAIRDYADNYAATVSPVLLADVNAVLQNPNIIQLAIPKPDLSQPWTVQNGNLYAGSNPIALNGFVWQFATKDLGYSLYNVGLNMQTLDLGPDTLIPTGPPPQLAPNIQQIPYVQSLRTAALIGQQWQEIFDLHTSPHYLPSWFSSWAQGAGVANENAWMDTNDGRQLLDLTYQGDYIAFGDIGAVKTADLGNEWTFWAASTDAQTAWLQWLTSLYGTIGSLNQRWGTSYTSFSQVPAPAYTNATTPTGVWQNRAPLWDWCCFNTQRAASVLSWMNTTLKSRYPGLFTHVKCTLSGKEWRTLAQNFILGIDPQRTLPITDLIGTDPSYIRSGYWVGTLFAYDYMKSICQSKPIYCSEMHAVAYDDGIAPVEIRRGLFQSFIHGARMNLLFLNTAVYIPDWWSSATPNSDFNVGKAPDAIEGYGTTSADLRRLASPMTNFASITPSVLIFYDNAADFGVPGSSLPPGQYSDRALLVYESLLYRDVKTSFVTESMLAAYLPTA